MANSSRTSGVVFALLRHGDYVQPEGVPSAHLPHGLTERGRTQSRGAASELARFADERKLPFATDIECSRMRRAWETAKLIAEELGPRRQPPFRVVEREALAERCLGAVANLTVEQIESIIRDDPRYPEPPSGWKRDPDYRTPFQGAESLLQAGQRLAEHLLDQARNLPPTPTLRLLVSHGGAIRHACHHLGILKREELARLSMYHATPIYLIADPSCPGTLRHLAGEWKRRTSATALD